MATDLNLIHTIVVVMMENRSFDHALGYLGLEGYPVNGLRGDAAWLTNVANPYGGYLYRPFLYTDDRLPADPPHERSNIAQQIGLESGYDLKGFVQSYARVYQVDPAHPPAVMGYYTKADVPLLDMFARSYAVCDRWFAPLPAGTQPNRLMAMSGMSLIDTNTHILPLHPLVYEWLEQRRIRWRVYHEGTPFFAMMPEWLPEIALGSHFRAFRDLPDDVHSEPDEEWPQVIFVEPKYGDDPTRIGEASDHHPPGSIHRGQEFLAEVYLALTANPTRWATTALIVTYDEHGGFFDHVPPEKVITSGHGKYPDFQTTGVRVPSFVISPLVEPQTVFSQRLDHTSILKFIGQKFAPNGYGGDVNARDVHSVAEVFNRTAPRTDVPKIPLIGPLTGAVPVNALAFQTAAMAMARDFPDQSQRWFPEASRASFGGAGEAP